MTTLPARTRPNGHTHEVDLTPGEVQCPYCGQSVSRKEFKEIQARMVAEEAARSAKREQQIKDGFAREMVKREAAKKAEIEKARREATAVADKKLKLLRANQDATIAARLDAERERAAKKQAEAVNAEKLLHTAEKLKLEEQLADMQRRLQAKTANQIGEPAEVDLFDALVAAFPGDRVSRVRKGARGPDVLVEIVHQDVAVGKIVLDSKAVSRWSNKFSAKLRTDQLAYGADFGVLVSITFPAGTRELHLQDNIVVVSPARVVVLVQLLRRHIIETYRLRITGRARNEKGEALLAYVVSPNTNDLFERRRKAADDMISLECKEVDQHHATWRKRGELILVVQKTDEELSAAIDRIIGAASDTTPEQEVAA